MAKQFNKINSNLPGGESEGKQEISQKLCLGSSVDEEPILNEKNPAEKTDRSCSRVLLHEPGPPDAYVKTNKGYQAGNGALYHFKFAANLRHQYLLILKFLFCSYIVQSILRIFLQFI